MNLGYVNRFSVKQVNLSCAPQRVIHHLPIERLATFFPLNSHSTNVRTIFGVQPQQPLPQEADGAGEEHAECPPPQESWYEKRTSKLWS